MSYYFARTLETAFPEAMRRAREALAAEGFGVLTEIDVQAIMKAKLGRDMPPYVILGACNPDLAFEALRVEPRIGTMLPCNVIVRDLGDERTEVAAINPLTSMLAVDNAKLHEHAARVAEKLRDAVDRLVA
jgi:uncharacterized protein (DUF302 family)